ncbi:MAG: transglutaminase family protein [Halioglobus sp.]
MGLFNNGTAIMWLRTQFTLAFDIIEPTPFLLMLRPRSGAQQWVATEDYRIEPSVPVFEFTDLYGNLCQRLVAQPGEFGIVTSAEVMTADTLDTGAGAPFVPVQDLPDDVLNFLLPSRYCETERFSQMTAEICADATPGYDQVAAIVAWVAESIVYDYEGGHLLVSAVEVNERGSGVCRDYAHLAIAMCRSLCIPARLVVGYLHELEPMDLHAWFEAYVGGRWYAFDVMRPLGTGGYVATGYGRDAADVAVFTQFGPPLIPRHLSVEVKRITREAAGDAI